MPAKIGIDGAVGRGQRLGREAARLGRTPARRGRFRRDDQREERAVIVVEHDRRRLARAGDVAGAPADLGEVDHTLGVQHVAPGQGLELGPGEGQ